MPQLTAVCYSASVATAPQLAAVPWLGIQVAVPWLATDRGIALRHAAFFLTLRLLPHAAASSFLSLSLFLLFFFQKKIFYKREREIERERGCRGRLKQRADPESLDAHLDPLESCNEWIPTLKVLTRHKNGANAPMKPIINEL